MALRLEWGRTLHGPQPGAKEIVDGLRRQAAALAVVGHDLGLGLRHRWEFLLEQAGEPQVELPTIARQERQVGRVLDQGVLEDVARAVRRAAAVEDLGLEELAERHAQGGPLDPGEGLQLLQGEGAT